MIQSPQAQCHAFTFNATQTQFDRLMICNKRREHIHPFQQCPNASELTWQQVNMPWPYACCKCCQLCHLQHHSVVRELLTHCKHSAHIADTCMNWVGIMSNWSHSPKSCISTSDPDGRISCNASLQHLHVNMRINHYAHPLWHFMKYVHAPLVIIATAQNARKCEILLCHILKLIAQIAFMYCSWWASDLK